jgi:hypothetical protein
MGWLHKQDLCNKHVQMLAMGFVMQASLKLRALTLWLMLALVHPPICWSMEQKSAPIAPPVTAAVTIVVASASASVKPQVEDEGPQLSHRGLICRIMWISFWLLVALGVGSGLLAWYTAPRPPAPDEPPNNLPNNGTLAN